MKIMIIGSGIAGLTMALACERAGFEVKLYEKTHGLKNIGGGIILWPHGIRYLKELGLFSALEPYSVFLKQTNIINHYGHTIFTEDCAAFINQLGGSFLPIERSILQQALLKQLSPNYLSLGKTCVAVSEDSKHARVKFSDGSEDEADIIVGADGIHSTVRQHILGKSTPLYTNLCWWGGVVDQSVVPNFSDNQSHVILGEQKTFIAWPTYNKKWMWFALIKMPLQELNRKGDGMSQLKDICKYWNADVERFIEAPTNGNNFHLGVHTLQPGMTWSSKRMTVIGDAAHAMGPILAQGTSLAIEDAFALTECLKQSDSSLATTFKYYESLRYPIYKQIYHLENQCVNTMVADHMETLLSLEKFLPQLNLATMYKELIPLVDEAASLKLMHTLKLKETVTY